MTLQFVFNPVESIQWAFYWNRTDEWRIMRIQECLVAAMFSTYQKFMSPPLVFFFPNNTFSWAASLPWKRSKHPQCDAPVRTKYLIIANSFSGRLCLHLRVSLSDLEMTDWQRGLSAFLHERRRSGGVCTIPHLRRYFKSSVSACLAFSISGLFTALNHQSRTLGVHLTMHVTLQAPLWIITAMPGVMLVIIDRSLH